MKVVGSNLFYQKLSSFVLVQDWKPGSNFVCLQ
jgi:hypothetical protein